MLLLIIIHYFDIYWTVVEVIFLDIGDSVSVSEKWFNILFNLSARLLLKYP
jgi:hypothetical protein